MKPLVTISCLAYNHGPFIRECLEGFMMQKVSFPFEVVIHDDASTDGTQDIIKEYVRRYPGIVFPIYQKENQWSKGERPTWDYNAPRWRGKYIAFCEGDDHWINPYKLQSQVDLLERDDDAFGSFHPIKKHITRNGRNQYIEQVFKDSKKEYYLIDLLKPWFIGTGSLVLRKDRIIVPTWMRMIPSMDIAMVISGLKDSYLLCYPVVSSVWRVHEGGISVSHSGVKKVMDMATLYHYINDHYNGRYSKEILKALEQEIYLHISRHRERDLIDRIKNGKELTVREHLQALSHKLKRRLSKG